MKLQKLWNLRLHFDLDVRGTERPILTTELCKESDLVSHEKL